MPIFRFLLKDLQSTIDFPFLIRINERLTFCRNYGSKFGISQSQKTYATLHIKKNPAPHALCTRGKNAIIPKMQGKDNREEMVGTGLLGYLACNVMLEGISIDMLESRCVVKINRLLVSCNISPCIGTRANETVQPALYFA